MNESDEVTALDLFIVKLPEITREVNSWVIHCSKCKRRFEKVFTTGSHSEGLIPIVLKSSGWQLTKKRGKVRILCPKCNSGNR